MPTVVRKGKFAQIVERNYVNSRAKLFEQAKQVLQHQKMRESIEGYCNAVLAKHMAAAITMALQSGSSVVKFEFSTAKTGQTLWKNWPPKLRQQIPVDLIVISMELLLSEAGFSVAPVEHMLRYSQELAAEEEERVEVVEEEDEENQNGTEPESLDELLAGTPALTGPVEGSDLGEGS